MAGQLVDGASDDIAGRMSGEPASTGGEKSGVFGTLSQMMRRLTPEFLGMLMVNTVFVGGMLWLFEKQNATRERVLTPLIASCAESVPLKALDLLAKPETAQVNAMVDDLRRQLKDDERQIDTLRTAVDNLRQDITQQTARRLTGPAR